MPGRIARRKLIPGLKKAKKELPQSQATLEALRGHTPIGPLDSRAEELHRQQVERQAGKVAITQVQIHTARTRIRKIANRERRFR